MWKQHYKKSTGKRPDELSRQMEEQKDQSSFYAELFQLGGAARDELDEYLVEPVFMGKDIMSYWKVIFTS